MICALGPLTVSGGLETIRDRAKHDPQLPELGKRNIVSPTAIQHQVVIDKFFTPIVKFIKTDEKASLSRERRDIRRSRVPRIHFRLRFEQPCCEPKLFKGLTLFIYL
jgi:hypothetical protein